MAGNRVDLLVHILVILFVNKSNCRSQPRVLVVSLDGFHYDYLNQFDLPNFQSFAEGGLHAVNGLKSFMTTKTLPVHWSLATGMYQEDTGFVGNWMYDPTWKESFKLNKTGLRNDRWLNGEPIWITAKKQGRRSGILDWIGSDVEMTGKKGSEKMNAEKTNPEEIDSEKVTTENPPEISGGGVDGGQGFPDKYYKYNSSRTFREKLDIVFDWFTGDDLNLVMMYHQEPDDTGHRTGAGSDAVGQVLKDMDHEWHLFMHKWNGHPNIRNELTIILLSDHGMVNVTDGIKVNFLEHFAPNELNSLTDYYDRGVVSNIFPKNATCRENILARLKPVEGIQVYKREEIPDGWHYKNNPRIGDIVVVAEEGNQITDGYVSRKVADHGYDPNLDSMKPFFAINGYKFTPGTIINDSNIETINLHSLVCKLLKIEPPEDSVGNWSIFLPSSSLRLHTNYVMFALAQSIIIVLLRKNLFFET